MSHYAENFDQIVYTVDHGGNEEVKEWILRDLCQEYADETSTPFGSGKVYFTEGNKVLRWEPSGRADVVFKCANEEAAEYMLLKVFLGDVDSNDNLMVFPTREAADDYYNEFVANREG